MSEVERQLSVIKSRRSQLRRLATVAFDAFEELLNEQPVDKPAIEEKFVVCNDRAERLFKEDRQVSELIFLSNADKEELAEEFDTVESYRERWLKLCHQREIMNAPVAKVQDDSIADGDSSSNSGVTTKKRRHLKLFKLQPKKFDGKLQNWLGFWAMFRAIHDDEDMDAGDKFQYLIELTEEGSPARDLLKSFPPTPENYPKAVKQLHARFGRTELLIELYVRELLKLVLMQATGRGNLSLRSLYDQLETQLRSLESLGVAKDNYANMLLPLVESSLPDNVLRQWERERLSTTELKKDEEGSSSPAERDQRLDLLLKFLRKEVEGEERLELAKNTFSSANKEVGAARNKSSNSEPTGNMSFQPKDHYRRKQFNQIEGNQSKPVPTATDLVNIEGGGAADSNSCIFCPKSSHKTDSCMKSYELPVSVIQSKLKDNGFCFLCLKRGHPQFRCKAFVKCIICLKRHNSLLCNQRKQKPESEKANKSVEHNLTNFHNSTVLLQTLRVKCRGSQGLEVRLLIDSGSQQSYATRHLIEKLGYKTSKN